MTTRLAVLEALAVQTTAILADLRQEMRDLGAEIRGSLAEGRRIHDRDFRITFGAIITTTIGLAALIAHVAHWL